MKKTRGYILVVLHLIFTIMLLEIQTLFLKKRMKHNKNDGNVLQQLLVSVFSRLKNRRNTVVGNY